MASVVLSATAACDTRVAGTSTRPQSSLTSSPRSRACSQRAVIALVVHLELGERLADLGQVEAALHLAGAQQRLELRLQAVVRHVVSLRRSAAHRTLAPAGGSAPRQGGYSEECGGSPPLARRLAAFASSSARFTSTKANPTWRTNSTSIPMPIRMQTRRAPCI